MKTTAVKGFGTKSIHGANFVSTPPHVPVSKLPSSSRPLDSVPLNVNSNSRNLHSFPQVPQLKPLMNTEKVVDVPDSMPWYDGETAHDYTMHLLALAGSDAFASDVDLAQSDADKVVHKNSKFSKIKPAMMASMFLNSLSKSKSTKGENSNALASFKALSALSEEEKLLYPSWMTEGDIQTRKFLAQKIVNNRNRMRALNIRADEILGTDDIREMLAKKYGLNEATYTEVSDMISNSRSKVKGVFDDINAIALEQQAVLQDVQRTLASTSTDLNFEVLNLEDRLDDLQEDSLLEDAERSLGHAKSMRIKLSTSHSRFLDQAVERLTTKMPQVVKIKHMEEDLVLAADSLETMRKKVNEHQANMVKFQREAQEKSETLKLCQKELSDVTRDRDRLAKSERELTSNVESWREKFYQCDRDLNLEVRRGEEAERQHSAILAITLKNAQKVVEDQMAATARAHEDQVKKLNALLLQLEQDLQYERRLRDPNAVLANLNSSNTKSASVPQTKSVAQQFEDMQLEKVELQEALEKLKLDINEGSSENERLNGQLEMLKSRLELSIEECKGLAAQSHANSTHHSIKELEMQTRIDSLILLLDESKSSMELFRSERDSLQGSLTASQDEVFRLKSEFQANPGAASTSNRKSTAKVGSFSVATQTIPIADASSPPIMSSSMESSQRTDVADDNIKIEKNREEIKMDDRSAEHLKPVQSAILKVVRGTQTDGNFSRFGEESARMMIGCTRSECVAALEELNNLKTSQFSLAAVQSEAHEANSKLTAQLAIRDREYKAALLKLKKESDLKIAFEKDSFTKVQTHHEQLRAVVKKKLETVMVEIKKMKRIGDFSNVGEIELHLNDVYIGATENIESFQAEIDARKDSEKKSTEISTGGKVFDNAVGSLQIVTVDDLKSTAENLVEFTQQFISGCSFGMNSSSVSLGRVQKKLNVCGDALRVQKKALTDSIFQLSLETDDLRQKLEDSKLVLKNHAAATARAERESRFWAKKLSVYEDVSAIALEFANSQEGTDAIVKKDIKGSGKKSKLAAASKAVLFAKASSKSTNVIATSESKFTSKAPSTKSGSNDALNSRGLSRSHSLESEDQEGNLSTCELDDFNDTCDTVANVASNDNSNDTSRFNSFKDELLEDVTSGRNNSTVQNPSSVQDSSQIQNFEDSPSVLQSGFGAAKSVGSRNNLAASESIRMFRRHGDELHIPSVSVIYQESNDVPPVLDFATQVELSSLRNSCKASDSKIRKLEQQLDDKHEQLQHFTLLMESSTRDHMRSRNHAMDLSLQVHLERSKSQAQKDENVELSKKLALCEETLKHERDAHCASRALESNHAQKLKDLTQKMQNFYERCELYVQEERAPFLALFFEFWVRLGLFKKDIILILSADPSEVCNFSSSCLDLSSYSRLDSSHLVHSFSEMLSRNSLPHLRDCIIQMFGQCCYDLSSAVHSFKITDQQGPASVNVPKNSATATSPSQQPASSALPKISKQETSSSPSSKPSIAHKQLVSSFQPKVKLQSSELAAVDDAMYRNSDSAIQRLTSKIFKSEPVRESETNSKLLATWDKLSTTGHMNALKPEKFRSESISSSLPLPSHNSDLLLRAIQGSLSPSKHMTLFPIQEGNSY